MLMFTRKQLCLISTLFVLVMMSGCTNWQRRYEYLAVEHENLKGRHETLRNERQQMADRINQDQQTIEELSRQIEQQNKTPQQATGFEGYDTKFNPNAGTITVTLPNAILFASGKAQLKSTTNRDLDQIYSVIQSKYSGKHLEVLGHTDTDPIRKTSWKDNWELSAQRALSVTRYLVSKGISEKNIRASGCGSARPVASNSSSSGKAKNRRVEIIVHLRG